ncbi:hypothetical protein E4V99_04920 [Microbacterium sp. dk485]|uniref:DUF6385 domain-containing protein n=1 Tax=Microbacterium sp. dk485 TaxID=2560021 RepID=UPI001073F3DA|nr:DUF6385 domain-containing protein [Microbacterium sp. dk485]TFV84406.1 hypothetical protein E4V99_04920 [Microbacterium sp. dk485]
MQQTYTSVIARRVTLDGDYATLPYEAGWAREVVIFLQTEGAHPDLTLSAEVSPDGINWIRRGTPTTLPAGDTIAEIPLINFGNWLRLTVRGATPAQTARILVHVNGKG